MLLPRYSLRTLLGGLTLCSLVFALAGLGLRGTGPGLAIMFALLMGLFALGVHALVLLPLLALAAWRRRARGPFKLPLLGFALLAGLTGGPARAFQFLSPPTSIRCDNGVMVDVLAHGPAPNGYQSLLLRVADAPLTGPKPTGTRSIELHLISQRATAKVDVSFAAGGSAERWALVPQSTYGHTYQLRVFARGRQVGHLFLPSRGRAFLQFDFIMPNVLAFDRSQNESELLGLLPAAQRGAGLATSLVTWVTPLPQPGLPIGWLHYSGYNLICLSLAQAEELAAKQPDLWRSFCAWSTAGGNLCISDAADGSARARIDDLLVESPSSAAPHAASTKTSSPKDDWRLPEMQAYQDQLSDFASEYARQAGVAQAQSAGANAALADVLDAAAAASAKAPSAPHFHWRRHGFGTVVAVHDQACFPGDRFKWGGLLNTLGAARFTGEQRLGAFDGQANLDFWRMMIPGVGFAPVKAFQILITSFVIVVGPLNYWWLRRRRRLDWLVLTVPLIALVATAGLVGYAFASEGLSTRFRARSLTLLDQRAKHAVSWTWQSYYASLAPPGGLTFDDQTLVQPVEYLSAVNPQGRAVIEWHDQRQQLVSGWLAPRTPTEFQVIRPRASEASLDLLPSGDDGALRVRNRLGTAIKQLWVTLDGAPCHVAENVPEAAAATLRPASTEVERSLAALHSANVPTAPSELAELLDLQVSSRRMFLFGSLQLGGAAKPPPDSPYRTMNNLAERTLRDELASGRWLQSPRRYVAVVEHSPEVQTGVARVEEIGSFHVILGQW